jgi:hypothetical protein
VNLSGKDKQPYKKLLSTLNRCKLVTLESDGRVPVSRLNAAELKFRLKTFDTSHSLPLTIQLVPEKWQALVILFLAIGYEQSSCNELENFLR